MTLSWDAPSLLGDTVELYLVVLGVLVDGNFPPENTRGERSNSQNKANRKKRILFDIPPLDEDVPQVFLLVNETATNETSLMFDGLLPFTTYIFTVSAGNAAGEGPGTSTTESTLEDGEAVLLKCVCAVVAAVVRMWCWLVSEPVCLYTIT